MRVGFFAALVFFCSSCAHFFSGSSNVHFSGRRILNSCDPSTGGPCRIDFDADPTACTRKRPCRNLVVFFADSSTPCPSKQLEVLSRAYKADHYVFVCADIFAQPDEARRVPYTHMDGRIDHMIAAIRDDEDIMALWSGERLLFSGVGLGATALTVAMTRKDLDEKRNWKGLSLTGACLMEGNFDASALERALRSKACSKRRKLEICDRYFPSGASLKRCMKINRFPGQSLDLTSDTVNSGAEAESFAIHDWLLMDCGSKLKSKNCGLNADLYPARPMERLCREIADGPGYRCTFKSFPQAPAPTCAWEDKPLYVCRDWFDQL